MAEDTSKQRLGRGLAALIGEMDKPVPGGAADNGEPVESKLNSDRIVPIESLRANPNNPRRNFTENDLDDLSQSISEHGLIQPILVRSARPVQGGESAIDYEIIAGERRWRAAQRAGVHSVPILVREVDDRQALELAIIENVQRADLNAIEEAQGYAQLVDKFSYTQEALAKVIGKSRSHLANMMRLLVLPETVQRMVRDNRLTAGHARAIINAPDPASLAREAVAKGLSVRQIEAAARRAAAPASGARPAKGRGQGAEKDADTRMLEGDLSAAIGMRVDIRHGVAGDAMAGEVRITYKSLEDLDRLCQKLAE